jgi:hypothetical protein
MLLDTRNKDIDGLGVEVSEVFEIFGHSLLKGGWNQRSTCHLMLLDTRNKNTCIYSLGVDDLLID